MYLKYMEYLRMGGTLDKAAFTMYEAQAADHVDYHSFNRLHGVKKVPEKVKRCVFRLIGLLYDDDNAAEIKSQSRDGVSVALADTKPLDQQIIDVIIMLSRVDIDGVPLLYRGV